MLQKGTDDKQLICDFLLITLQATEYFADLVKLKYIDNHSCQLVRATFANGSEKLANVSMDNGIGMIIDILRQIL